MPLVVARVARRDEHWEFAPFDFGLDCEPNPAMDSQGSIAIAEH